MNFLDLREAVAQHVTASSYHRSSDRKSADLRLERVSVSTETAWMLFRETGKQRGLDFALTLPAPVLPLLGAWIEAAREQQQAERAAEAVRALRALLAHMDATKPMDLPVPGEPEWMALTRGETRAALKDLLAELTGAAE